MRAAVMMSDQRMKIMADMMRVHGIEVDEGADDASIKAIISQAEQYDVLVMGIRGVSDAGFVEISRRGYCVDELFEHCKSTVKIFTGLITPYLKKQPYAVISLLENEEVASENARLTAEGILHLIIINTDRSLVDYTYDIIGWGHCGKAIWKLFNKLDLNCRMVSRRKLEHFRGKTMLLEDWQFTQPNSIVINTAPSEVVTMAMADSWKEKPLLIDLASGAVGVNEKVYKRKDIQVIAAPPLPGIIAYKSAGEILAKVVLQEVGK